MNVWEHAVLDAVNIATTKHRDHRRQRYQATAAEIAETLRTDERITSEFAARSRLSDEAVQNYLIRLGGGRNAHRSFGPLIRRVGTKGGKTLYALTDAGARVLGA